MNRRGFLKCVAILAGGAVVPLREVEAPLVSPQEADRGPVTGSMGVIEGFTFLEVSMVRLLPTRNHGVKREWFVRRFDLPSELWSQDQDMLTFNGTISFTAEQDCMVDRIDIVTPDGHRYEEYAIYMDSPKIPVHQNDTFSISSISVAMT